VFENIVVALDGSASAMRAFELALMLAKVKGSKIVVCNVLDSKTAMWSGSSNPSAEQALDRAVTEGSRIVAKAVERAREAGLNVEGRSVSGDAAAEIVNCAIATGADAIVMGTHGWSGIKHFVMGSVAELVLRSAPCPVVVVRDTDHTTVKG
jgi:nucleotide-binding universal stress UspA family protein